MKLSVSYLNLINKKHDNINLPLINFCENKNTSLKIEEQFTGYIINKIKF